jgi:hypothetical protein
MGDALPSVFAKDKWLAPLAFTGQRLFARPFSAILGRGFHGKPDLRSVFRVGGGPWGQRVPLQPAMKKGKGCEVEGVIRPSKTERRL